MEVVNNSSLGMKLEKCMSEQSEISVMNLNVAAGLRQAIGVQFERTEATPRRLNLLKNGVIHLSPHPKWKGKFTDWEADPYDDRNWKFQFHTLRWLNPLVWSALDGDEESKTEWKRIVKSWYSANIPAGKAKSPFAWKDMADGNRAVQLCIGASLIDSSDLWFVRLLEAHRDWLLDDNNIVLGNHALHQNIGLFVVGAVLRDTDAMNIARSRMVAQFESAFDEEGINEEGSVTYHQLNLAWWNNAAMRLELEQTPFPNYVLQRLEAAASVLVHLVLPNGYLPQIGDGHRNLLRVGLSQECDYAATDGQQGVAPTQLVRSFSNGYYTSRSGWGATRSLKNESQLIMRHGGEMIGHAHQDRGSLHVYSRGTAWLVDSGFHSYQKRDPVRTYLNSRDAHNVASVVGEEYQVPDYVAVVAERESDQYHYVEVHDSGFPGNLLRRRVIYLTQLDCWIVQDTNDGDAAYNLKQSWHINVGIRVSRHDRGFMLRDGNANMLMTWLGPPPELKMHRAGEDDLRGWIGTKWKTLEPGRLVTAQGPSSTRGLVLLLSPASKGDHIGIVSSYVTTAGVIDMVLTRGTGTWSVRIDSSEVVVTRL